MVWAFYFEGVPDAWDRSGCASRVGALEDASIIEDHTPILGYALGGVDLHVQASVGRLEMKLRSSDRNGLHTRESKDSIEGPSGERSAAVEIHVMFTPGL